MNKEFIPYDLALALKELGFDEVCLAMYTIAGLDLFSQRGYAIPKGGYTNTELSQDSVLGAPTFSQAFRWFRDKGFVINIYSKGNDGIDWYFLIKKGTIDTNDIIYKTYEEAELACLKKLIEIIKTK